jgi:hypothetical protein
LALADNTLAIGWLFMSSKFPASSLTYKAHLMVAQQLASLLLKHNHCLATQHINGDTYIMPDLLSFAGTDHGKVNPLAYDCPTDLLITQCFHQHLPDQIPANFAKVLSWVVAVLQMHKLYLAADKRALMSPMTEACTAGLASALNPASLLTPSSLLYPSKKLTLLPKLSSRATK